MAKVDIFTGGTAQFAYDRASELADFYSYLVDHYHEVYVETIITRWENVTQNFNPGQHVTYLQDLAPVIYDFLEDLGDGNWPYEGMTDNYINSLWEAEEPNFIERAFSDSILGPTPDLYEIEYKAIDAQMKADVWGAVADALGLML